MTHEVIKHLLDDYVTGDLTEEARSPVEDHIASCAICAAEVQGLTDVLERAKELPRSIEPTPEAWAAIRSEIVGEQSHAIAREERAIGIFGRRPLLVSAAAAAVIAVLSSTATALYMNARHSDARQPIGTADNSTPTTLAAFTVEENNYLRTAGALEDMLDQQEQSLAPETVAQLKASLRTIDEAILEARTALARDPANRVLVEMLSANYSQKIDLLRRTTEMTRGT
jgi:anti-sigma-K factor RskA